MHDERILVVGTTADYIAHLDCRYPGRALFVTDARERARAVEPAPDQELLCDMADADGVESLLNAHLDRRGIAPRGIVCFDCESLSVAARIARSLSLPFPTPEAVSACRNKFSAKHLWEKAGVPCPEAAIIDSPDDAVAFLDRAGKPIVLKPLTGSGGELVFTCTDGNACVRAVSCIRERLAVHGDNRMYRADGGDSHGLSARRMILAETYVSGTEYSCDVLISGRRLDIIRIARKIPSPDQPAGTTLAYVLPETLPAALDPAAFRSQLYRAARVLGLDRAVCMVDFIVRDGTAWLLEMTPRPGGDCIPRVILHSCGLDMLGLMLDVSEGRSPEIPDAAEWKPLVGLRLFAAREGVIRSVRDTAIRANRRVCECVLRHGTGHRVVLPPDDYDSRLIGHVVFEPSDAARIDDQCSDLYGKLEIEMEYAS